MDFYKRQQDLDFLEGPTPRRPLPEVDLGSRRFGPGSITCVGARRSVSMYEPSP